MKRQPIIWGIILILLMMSLNPIICGDYLDSKSTGDVIEGNPLYLFSFNTYIDLGFNLSVLNEPIPLEETVIVPVTVYYWTNIPDFFYKIPWRIRNIILYGRVISPMISIFLQIDDIPDWADISFSSSMLHGDIPFDGDGQYEIETDLFIKCSEEAPATSYKLDVKAALESIGRLNGFSYQESIEFTPEFRPGLEISGFESIFTPPDEEIVFPIFVKNTGNKISRIIINTTAIPSSWQPYSNQPNIIIIPGDTETFEVSVTAPSDFNGSKIFKIEFIDEVYPLHPNSPTGIYDYYFQVFYY